MSNQLTAAQYHADYSRVSNSMLSVFRQSRKRYYERFVACTEPPPEPTAPMRLGSLVHMALLEPALFGQVPVVDQQCEGIYATGANKGKRCVNEASGTHEGRWLCGVHSKGLTLDKPPTHYVLDKDADALVPVSGISTKEAAEVKEICEAVMDSPHAYLLTQPGDNEETIWWRDPLTKQDCKCRVDRRCRDVIVDVKVTHDATPAGFASKCADLGYFRQNAFYVDGIAAKEGEILPFVFLCVSPKTLEVGAYDLDATAVDMGRTQIEKSLRELESCKRRGDWKFVWQREIVTVTLPKRIVYAQEYEAIE